MSLPEISHIASLIDSGQSDQAKALLNDVLMAVPNHLSATVLLAKVHDLDATGNEALAFWKKAVYLCPGNPVIEKGLRKAVARQLFSDSNYTEAVSEHVDAPFMIQDAVVDPSAEGVSAQRDSEELNPPTEYQDLDKLISELESARIVPDPDIEMIPQGELETEIGDVVSETLARIYAKQKFFAEAASVYDKLAIQRPEKEAEFLQKASELRQKVNAKG